ncbi:MAG: T9SS type A sorting domain-containing protein [Saprospiraceae bacterium]
MLTSIRHSSRTALIFFCFSFFFTEIKSQCSPPGQLPDVQCNNAGLFCLQGYCAESLNFPLVCCQGWCGPNTIINNPQYFQFIATAEDVYIEIHVDNCSGGTGLQSAVVTSCDWAPCPGSSPPCPDILDCNPGTSPGGSMILTPTGLIIGQLYWLLIDGSNGATCQYTIEYVSGVFEPQIDEELDPSLTEAIPNIVCQGYDDFTIVTGPTILNAHGYLWILGWSNLTYTSTYPEITLDILNNAPPGIWNVCVRAFSGCDTTDNEVCVSVEIVELADAQKDPAIFCAEDFPFLWHGIVISGPGTYTKKYDNADGCPYDSIWMVDAYPDIILGQVDTFSCQVPFIYNGMTYYDSGTYPFFFPGMSVNGCDSSAILNLVFENVDLFIEQTCELGHWFLNPYIIFVNPSVDTLSYKWYNCDSTQILSDQKKLEISSPGCYCLIVDSGFCRDTICSYYNTGPCSFPCSVIEEKICPSDSVLFFFNGTVDSDATYHWLIEMPGGTGVFYSEQDTVSLRYQTTGCYRASLTIVSDTNSFTCVDSFCIDPISTSASICCSAVSCFGCADLTFNLSGGAPLTIVLSDGHGLDTISGIITSSYVYTVCLLQPIDTFTLLSVYGFEDLCPGSIIGNNSVIIDYSPAPAPVIEESSTMLCANSNMSAYHWYECDSTITLSNTQCFTPSVSGCYCVEIFTLDSCTSIMCTDFVVAVNEVMDDSAISLFPNPTLDKLQITLPEDISLPVNWNLLDQLGIKHLSGVIHSTSSRLDMENIPPGVYFLEMKYRNGNTGIYKVIIE